MAIGFVKRRISWKDASGKNAGQLFVGDTVYGSVTTVFNFYRIRRADGKDVRVNGTCSRVGLDITNEAEPNPNPAPTPTPVPPGNPGEKKRYFVLHDWQSGTQNPPYTVREVAPDPEVNRVGFFDDHKSHNKVRMTRPIQMFCADLMAMQRYGKLFAQCSASERRYITAKFTALYGPQTAFANRPPDNPTANYVAGENLQDEPPRLAPLICGGNTVWGEPAGRNKYGRDMVRLYSFVEGQALPPVTYALLFDPRILWATAIYGLEKVYPFEQLNGLSVPYPFITKEVYFYPADGLEEYEHSLPPRSQYVPAREYYP